MARRLHPGAAPTAKLLATCALACILASPLAAPAGSGAAPPEVQLEARVAALSAELRCLVCQNQTLADSQAELAVDLRRQIREQMRAGRSEAQVADFMVQRYGDFILYRPPFKASTLLLWFAPPVLVLGGALALLLRLRKPGQGKRRRALSEVERTRAASLLAGREELP
ncbi:cytochrome c-type biogenesis protein [Pseudoduganella violacea]|uniref:Cytochrome c-type biogenesis protein n=1 Tax=Pseudoduganella violacea TaxID=1715466 RepID=A0A7W5FW69_9BURK|nr:cytochrome c-type biogenesis protein [Pseudoduganella violacea]MBB3120953.1 cytochrome c-type biogenesis protein CcmH [Pseudoduganella violacea]